MPEQQTRLLAERYELIAPLGRGTMGTVWRARDRALGREVAVKEIRQDPGLTEEQRGELRERMVREGRIAARINHPSVASIHDVLIHANAPWIIMELVEARSLEQVIDEEGPLPPRLVAEIGVDLLGALRAAHIQGITHRDVKPGNVLITETGRVVLTDFGIAKAEGDSRLTKTGMVIGSPGYTAPERARGEYTGPESDIWSLGATLYFAVEGRPAYERSTISETLAALLSENADPPTQAGQLRPVLTGLLNKDYKQRLSAAKAETMLRMIADTPTNEIPAITDDVGPSAVPPSKPSSAGTAGRPQPTNQGQAAPRPGNAGPQNARPQPGNASPQPGGPSPKARPQPTGPAGPQPSGRQPAGPQQAGPRPAGPQPGAAPMPVTGMNATAGPQQQGRPGAQQQGQRQGQGAFDPEQTISVSRPKKPLPPNQQPPRPPADEAAITTTRIHQRQVMPGAPGQQVYPVPAPPPGQAALSQQGPVPPMPQGFPPQKGLGTDLFAIAGNEEQRPAGSNRTGMLVLMAVAAAAAVIIAILIVALING